MISVEGNDIILTRGDTETLAVTVTDSGGQPYTLGADEYIELVVAESADTDDVLIRKTTTDGNIAFSRADTWGLSKGKYPYNLRVEDGTAVFHTFLEGKFVIASVVDDASDD